VEPSKTPVVEPSKTPVVEPSKTPVVEPSKTPVVEPSKTPVVAPGPYVPPRPPDVTPRDPSETPRPPEPLSVMLSKSNIDSAKSVLGRVKGRKLARPDLAAVQAWLAKMESVSPTPEQQDDLVRIRSCIAYQLR
jgi:hypothetical protein